MFDLASHSAFVTGEWYIPGHKLKGLRSEDDAFMLLGSGEKVEETEIGFEFGGSILEEEENNLGLDFDLEC